MDFYFLAKALHIIFVVTWFAGLFYIVRLFIYHTEARDFITSEPHKYEILSQQFKIMERRLMLGITWPSAILTILFGFSMISNFLPLADHPWLLVKLFFVLGLFLYHLYCHRLFKHFQNDEYVLTSMQLRIFNEVATLFLFAIVFLVILRDLLQVGYGLLGLLILSFLLMSGIMIYRKIRP